MGGEISETVTNAGRFEKLAMFASVACAVECAVKPFALVLLPLVGVTAFGGEWLEYAFLGLVLVFGLGSIAHRFFFGHCSYRPVMIFAAGFTALLGGHFVIEESSAPGIAVAAAGAVTIGVSQYLNRRISKDCCEFHRTMDG